MVQKEYDGELDEDCDAGNGSPGRDRFDARYGCRRVETGVES